MGHWKNSDTQHNRLPLCYLQIQLAPDIDDLFDITITFNTFRDNVDEGILLDEGAFDDDDTASGAAPFCSPEETASSFSSS